ncbi:hypothetical protein B1R94_04740 [Mycolicibacterium litorale]|nr:hypothetical protein B1R94_04740 [Mycolicibacterium litorale]
MKRTLTLAAASVAAAITATAFAGTAHAADPNAVGSYDFNVGTLSTTWTATPCINDDDHCIHVSAGSLNGQAPWAADAFWSVGSWILFADQPDAITCDDGTKHPGRMSYSWDAATLKGWASIYNNGVCGTKPYTMAAPFTLTKLGPAEMPNAA